MTSTMTGAVSVEAYRRPFHETFGLFVDLLQYTRVSTSSQRDGSSREHDFHSEDPGPVGLYFYNMHPLPQYVSADWATKDIVQYPDLDWTYMLLQPNESKFIPTRPTTSPKFFIGPTPNNRTAEVDGKRDHDTVVEATFVGAYNTTYYDVDIEKGFSVPVWCVGAGDKWHTGEGCLANVLAFCPAEDRHYDRATGMYDQCRLSGSRARASTIRLWRQLCPDVYVLADDHSTKVASNSHVVECYIMEPRMVNVFANDLKMASSSPSIP
ncbi:hypothetical protein MBLNU459_g6660t1 [Dothideomycetes sp. NU459]